jgi:hypothetical protein
MTIEATLERIAAALESIAAGGGTVAPAAERDDPKPEKAPPKKSSTKKSAEKRIGTEDVADPDYTKEMVRAKLQELQKATTPAQAKSILKSHGASTIGNLPASKYKQVIDECDKKLEE